MSNESPTTDPLTQRLHDLGYIAEPKPLITDFTPWDDRTLITIEGKPISGMIVEDRR